MQEIIWPTYQAQSLQGVVLDVFRQCLQIGDKIELTNRGQRDKLVEQVKRQLHQVGLKVPKRDCAIISTMHNVHRDIRNLNALPMGIRAAMPWMRPAA
jgi:hypothetical protein